MILYLQRVVRESLDAGSEPGTVTNIGTFNPDLWSGFQADFAAE